MHNKDDYRDYKLKSYEVTAFILALHVVMNS